MNDDFPVGETFPDDDLAPVTAESVRYVYQLRRVNRVVIGLRELDTSLAERIRVATGLVQPVNEGLTDTRLALEEHAVELAAQRERHEDLVTAVKALEDRLPDPKQVRHQILDDLWLAFEGRVWDNAVKVGAMFDKSARDAAAQFVKAGRRGYLAPERPADGSSIGARLVYRRDLAIYRLRKFAMDWFVVTQMVGVASLVCLVAALFFR